MGSPASGAGSRASCARTWWYCAQPGRGGRKRHVEDSPSSVAPAMLPSVGVSSRACVHCAVAVTEVHVGEVAPSARRSVAKPVPRGHRGSFGSTCDYRQSGYTQLQSCRAHCWTSGRPLGRPTTLPSERTPNSLLASRCCCSVCRSSKLSRALLTPRAALVLSAIFGLSMRPRYSFHQARAHLLPDRSIVTLPVLGVPASIAFGYVVSRHSNSVRELTPAALAPST